MLGLTAEAVRSRIKRGTLKSTKEGGTVYVLLTGQGQKRESGADRTATEHDRTADRTTPGPDQTGDRAELVDVLRDQVEYLREQLGEEREARRRADMLLARLAEANANMAGEIRELTAPERPLDEPDTGEEALGGASPRPDTVRPHGGVQEPEEEEEMTRRPWWLRWLGG